ncbi:PrsW family glutamic-type intramembrane protease [Chloroflexota bacterium]
MLDRMFGFLVSGFVFPGLSSDNILIGIGLALAFGAVWFAMYWTPVLKKSWSWAVLVSSFILSWIAVSFLQIPLQLLTGQALTSFLSNEIIMKWLLLAGLPGILYSGLVQEGAKLVPVVVYWWSKGKKITPKQGLIAGAVAGLGLGVFEAVWVHNTVFSSGWTWAAVESGGFMALAFFWERFFVVPAHIAFSAIAGYGLAKGKGWQFYLFAAALHTLINYSALLLQSGLINTVYVEIYVAVVAMGVAGSALWLRWRKTEETINLEGEIDPEDLKF